MMNSDSRDHPETLSAEEITYLIQELRWHQVKLNSQNEELSKSQEELFNASKQFFDLYDLAPVGYLQLNNKGQILESNLSAATLFGKKKNALVNRPLSQFVAPEDQETYYLYSQQLLSGLIRYDCELRLLREDDSQIWARLETTVIQDKTSGVPRMYTIVIDITERIQAEESLRHSQARLQTILDTTVNAIISVDQFGVVQLFNKAAEGMFGYAAEEIIGHNVNRLMPPLLRVKHDASIATYLRTGNPNIIGQNREVKGQRKDGSILTLSIGIGEFQERNERFFTAVLQDISERKQAEKALRESEERLSLVMKASGEGFWDWDISHDRAIHNYKWYDLLGLDENGPEYTPSYFTTLLHEDDREMVLGRLKKALESGGLFQSEHRLLRGDGRYIWVLEHGVVVKRDREGKPLRMVGSFVDISERKNAEQQQREHQDHYEQLLKLEVASQTVAAIAHDLNQPLSAAASYTDAAQRLLEDEEDIPEKLMYALKKSAQQIQRAGAVVHELFTFLNTGETVTAPIDLNEMVRKVMATIKGDGYLGEFTAVLNLKKQLPKVIANDLQLEKVLYNVIQNGIDAMRDSGQLSGSIVVTVSTAENGSLALITIRDSGPGITEGIAKKIFEPFYSTKPHGLGMGLSISRALVAAQGGALWHQPNQGSGAIFHLTIPLESETLP